MHDKILLELSIAMSSQPSLTIVEVIDEALNLKFATRKYDYGYMVEKVIEKWKPTNEDIYNALVTYNNVRA
jgi:hypothetical protein